MMAECAQAFEIDSSYVWVYLSDLAQAVEFGSPLPASGGEKDWYEALPQDVKERYVMDA